MTTPTRPERRPVSPAVEAARARRERRELLKPTRRRALVRRWVVLVTFLGVVAVLYIVFFTGVLGVRQVDVEGIKGLTADEVRVAAAVEMGKPLIRLDTDEIAERVSRLPRVWHVSVERSWPTTVTVTVDERGPVGYVGKPDGAHMVDASGVDFAVIPQPPTGLPVLDLATPAPDDPATRAVVEVLGRIPQQLRGMVTGLGAKTAGSVQLTLTDGRVVRWGNSADSERKAMVLAALLTRPGKTYDVSAPDLPTVS
jgi:cell division protein FtsQ